MQIEIQEGMLQQIIDTHIHVWDFQKARYEWLKGNTTILNRSYSIGEIESERRAVGITEGVLVQAANNFEDTDWMLYTAERTSWLSGVVGWLPLLDPDATFKALERYSKNSYFKGVRHLIHDEQDPQWLLQKPVLESLKVLADHQIPYDVVGVLPEHIETVLAVAEKLPHLRMVFDHLNQPPIKTGEKFGRWGELMKQAASHPNFYAKISGLGTTAGNADWAAEDLKPYIAFALGNFGSNRCFCGGDWPVSLLGGTYQNTWEAYKNILNQLLSKEEQEKVFYFNAKNFYSL